MAFIDTLHIITILCSKLEVVAFGLAHFQVLFSSLLSFRVYVFLSPLIFLLGLFTLFLTFYYFFIFKIWKTTCRKQGMYIFTRLIKFNSKFYEPYYYRTLTQQKQNPWQQVKLHVRLFGWGRSWLVCSVHI